MMSDAEFLAQAIPFGNKLPGKMMQAQKKEEENQSYRNVSCDIMLLGGTCVVNEAILTGEAIPQIKEAIASSDLSKKFHESRYKGNILFCGTEILQINDDYHEE
jgi:cation-transporting ATPase 13A1